MLRSDSKQIDGVLFTTTQLPPLRAMRLLPRVAKVVAPLASLIEHGSVDLNEALPIVMGVLDRLDDDAVLSLLRDLLAGTTAQMDGRIHSLNSDDAITTVFGGRLPTMIKAAAFSLEVNYGDFFANGFAPSNVPAAQAASPSISTTTSQKDG